MNAHWELAEILRAAGVEFALTGGLDFRLHVAAAILSSDWLAQRDREVAAKAWDEGWKAGAGDAMGGHHTFNPYSAPEPIPERCTTTCASRVRNAACDCPRG